MIRNTAAQQLGDVQKQHPDELFHLLAKVIPYLKARTWDTRTATAKAIGAIVENAECFDPNPLDKREEVDVKAERNGDATRPSIPPTDQDRLRLEPLDIYTIIAHGKKLLGSGTKEHEDVICAMDHATWLAFQRKIAPVRLGLLGGDTDEQITTILENMPAPPSTRENGKRLGSLPKVDTSDDMAFDDDVQSPAPLTAGSPPPQSMKTSSEEMGLSKRQLNQLKRKKKLDAKSQANKVRVVDLSSRRLSHHTPAGHSGSEPVVIKSSIKSEADADGDTDMFSLKRGDVDEDAKIVADFKGIKAPDMSIVQSDTDEEGIEWPFERLCEVLVADLFDAAWEVRHGAAMALREIVRVHGAGAGREKYQSREQNDVSNEAWLNDLASRLCCVLMLDRFGDYISDNVVAPIRETVGQTLGAVLSHLPSPTVKAVYEVLYRMVMQEDLKVTSRVWEVCHGGMTGMRYLVAVRSDCLIKDSTLMDGVVEAVMKGLADFDDDVRAVSAATLIPIAGEFVSIRPTALEGLMNIVWDCLSDIRDDLSASTGFVMDLLAKLCSFPEALAAMKRNAEKDYDQAFANLVPRLYPFLRHTITSVRTAVLRALQTFLHLDGADTPEWANGKILRLIFQNLAVERNEVALRTSLEVFTSLLEVMVERGNLEAQLTTHMDDMIALTLQPVGVSRNPLPTSLHHMMKPSGQLYGPANSDANKAGQARADAAHKGRKQSSKKDEETPTTHNIDAHMLAGDVDLVGFDTLVRSRVAAAKALGKALSVLPRGNVQSLGIQRISEGLNSQYSTTQTTSAVVIEEIALTRSPEAAVIVKTLIGSLLHILEDSRPEGYLDIISYLRIVRTQCRALVNAFRDHGKVPESKLPNVAALVLGESDGQFAFRMSNADTIVGSDFERLKRSLAPAQRFMSTQVLSDARVAAVEAIDAAKEIKAERDTRIKAAAACALVAVGEIPKKPSSLIKGIMDSIKMEENVELQKRSAVGIASLLDYYARTQKRGPADKITANLTSFYCMDTSETPDFGFNAGKSDVILSLHKEEDRKDHTANYEREARAARITRRGTREALDQLCILFGAELFGKAPVLRTKIQTPLQKLFGENPTPLDGNPESAQLGQEAVDSLSVLRSLVPAMHSDLNPFTLSMVPFITKALRSSLSVFRYAAAKCFATICSVLRVEGMTILVRDVLPYANSDDSNCRQGVIELVYHLIHVMDDAILPYVIFLIVPVLGRMSDSDNDIRLIATTTFATLVKLVPLEAGIPDPPGFPDSLLEGRDRERKFMSQMLDVKKVEPFQLPVAIKAELRSYQQDGVNWLAFLNRYHLHGILCDDMGLGKTLQTLCIVASDHHMRAEEFAKTQAPDARKLPSLIVCPPTLSGHWQQEIAQFAPFLSCLAYVGPTHERAKFRSQLGTTDIVVTSYDVCRNDIDAFAAFTWNYCILDEGHLIKNPRAKTTLAVKRLASNHRLILSGTPIQNNVLELWSLFDFLMPGFLGTEKVFLDRFAKPIANSRNAKVSSKEQEAGALAIEALHKQVLPFLLRRLKEEVLNDLPPKILQNYYCDLSDLQKRLFDDFAKKERKSIAEEAGSDSKEAKQHIFQALQYMRKLCNSPALILKEDHKQYAEITAQLMKQNSSIKDITHAPKLSALRDLLLDCGIGSDPAATSTFVSPHRALIFCQMKEMLDVVAETVFKKMLPTVQYLRLDGSVEANKRQNIVNQFNMDPSYDCLLLTTSVGGLGLNLTGADTVIFVEHDWNPQKDMQAMDRAHRIGQKKVVNVYRLVTRGTLEEKILKFVLQSLLFALAFCVHLFFQSHMIKLYLRCPHTNVVSHSHSLQRFKIDVASTVVNQQNAGLATMETDQILDLFNLDAASSGGTTVPHPSNPNADIDGREENMVDATTGEVKEKGKKGWLDDLGELWDEKAYEEEFDLGGFLKGMKM